MIVIRIEMWPGGNKDRAYSYGDIIITNVGGNAVIADYKVEIMKSPTLAKSAGVWKRGIVEGFNRKRQGPQDLLLRALIACIGGRSKGAVASVDGPGPHFGPPEAEEPMP